MGLGQKYASEIPFSVILGIQNKNYSTQNGIVIGLGTVIVGGIILNGRYTWE